MNTYEMQRRESVLGELDKAVQDTVAYFQSVPEDLFDGYLTAREVMSHLVFWHEEYVQITTAMLRCRVPTLHDGSFARINSEAAEQLLQVPYAQLMPRLCAAQQQFRQNLLALPDWKRSLPVKKGGRTHNVTRRLAQIRTHLYRHINRMQRAERHGEAWVQAYFVEE